ncbi:YggT family protein [Sulfurimonas aquatica]|uniref:YggT family protein n=1 Tax=Sulfurimonas aquatica TaxID=2672570 RepID=A0A975GCK3_9BACT|nr:YggT family protein [Sulfurimonas aquatica]QSZ41796.1 YggT family protein [Sulfurimonas aquatica]
MSLIYEIIQGLGSLAIALIGVYIWVFIIAALLSFVNPDPNNQVVQLLYRITNPAYKLVRRYIRTDFNGLDLAPLVIIIALQVIIVVLRALLNAI